MNANAAPSSPVTHRVAWKWALYIPPDQVDSESKPPCLACRAEPKGRLFFIKVGAEGANKFPTSEKRKNEFCANFGRSLELKSKLRPGPHKNRDFSHSACEKYSMF